MVLSAVVVPWTTRSGAASGRGAQRLARNALARGELGEAAEDADRLVVRRRRVLGEDEPAVRGSEHEVGEGSADVDPDAVAHRRASVHRTGRSDKGRAL